MTTRSQGNFNFSYDPFVVVPLDFEQQRVKRATVFAARLAPGRYELVDVQFFFNQGQFGSQTFRAQVPFAIAFDVAEGRATYLGEFIAENVTRKNLFGADALVGGVFVVRDELRRDQALLAKRYPEMATLPVDDRSTIATDAGLPYFRAR